MMKYIYWLVLTIIIFGAGFLVSQYIVQRSAEKTAVQTEVVLDKVKEVMKLVTVEGYFTEFYNYKNYYNYDWSIFRKKAMVRIKARVSMGVDMEKMKITVDEGTKKIVFSEIPPADIISIDHDLDYYDITEGTFNSFTNEDYNMINKGAKEYIEQVALQSDLKQKAQQRVYETLQSVKLLMEASGWQVEIEAPRSLPN